MLKPSTSERFIVSRRGFWFILVATTAAATGILQLSKPEQKNATETVYDIKRWYNELNTNFENFFFLASRNDSSEWKRNGNKKTLTLQRYAILIESDSMILIIQDKTWVDMRINYVMESWKFTINRENVDRDIIRSIDRAMGELQEFFQK